VPEAAIWLVLSAAAWYWDTREIAKAIHTARDSDDDVLYITDDEAESVTTQNYELRPKNR
jgi:hypothetical protein